MHDAATHTTGAISRLVHEFCGGNVDSWSMCAYQICAALALAERGSRLTHETGRHATRALFDALNPLLADRLDHGSIPAGGEFAEVENRLLATVKSEYEQQQEGFDTLKAKRQQKEGLEFTKTHFAAEVSLEKLQSFPQIPDEALSLLSSELRAALNTMLHISDNVAAGEVCPGNVFFMQYGADNRKRVREKITDTFWTNLRDDTLFLTDAKLPDGCMPLLVEFSESCDFAQAKTKVPKFIAGLLVPDVSVQTIRQTGYNRALGPLVLSNATNPDLNGVYSLVLNAHFITGIEPAKASELVPTYRLRAAILSDFIAWIGSHITRPGVLHVGP